MTWYNVFFKCLLAFTREAFRPVVFFVGVLKENLVYILNIALFRFLLSSVSAFIICHL